MRVQNSLGGLSPPMSDPEMESAYSVSSEKHPLILPMIPTCARKDEMAFTVGGQALTGSLPDQLTQGRIATMIGAHLG